MIISCRLETDSPTTDPTQAPTDDPTSSPTRAPTYKPSKPPTQTPTSAPSDNPSSAPTNTPTAKPTVDPTKSPTDYPSKSPTKNPTDNPSISPTEEPTISPSKSPSAPPTVVAAGNIDSTIPRIHLVTSSDINGAVMGGIIGALIFLLLCCCCLALAAAYYFWYKKKKLEGEVEDAKQGENMSVVSSIPPVEGVNDDDAGSGTPMVFGTASTGSLMSTGPYGYSAMETGQTQDKKGLVSSQKKEHLRLLRDHSSDEDEDEFDIMGGMDNPADNLYDPNRMKSMNSDAISHDNGGIITDHDTRGLSLDEDEDVLPKEDEDDEDLLVFKI